MEPNDRQIIKEVVQKQKVRLLERTVSGSSTERWTHKIEQLSSAIQQLLQARPASFRL